MRGTNHHSEWKPVFRSGRQRLVDGGIYSEEQLHRLIQYERARADRNGSTFSLVLCSNGRTGKTQRTLRAALPLLEANIRTTDHLGWYDRLHLGLVLPRTDGTGALQLVRSLHDQSSELSYSVHTYPDEWSAPGSGTRSVDEAHHFAPSLPIWKRTIDLCGASVGLFVLSPLLILLTLYIKLVSPGPALFRQSRIGLARREFEFLKFRTMHCNSATTEHSDHLRSLIRSDEPMKKLDRDDPRIIRGGRILRKLSVDELPQLINVLRGEMTLVGPRPCIPYEAEAFLQWHAGRFSLVPGLTGLWQVSGKNRLSFQQMIRLDIEYQHRLSLWFDLWIIVRTFPTLVVLAMEGAGNRIARGKKNAQAAGSKKDIAVS